MEGLNSEDDDDWLRTTPSSEVKEEEEEEEEPVKKRQRKVITLDDILEADHKESMRKLKPRKNAKLLQKLRGKSHLYASSDSSDDGEGYRKPRELLEELEKQVATVAEEVEPEWGLAVLALAPSGPPSLARGGAPSVLRALQASKEAERETSLEELARSGFLRAWACCSNLCDESTLRWAYHQMAYASDEALERACCKFLCDLVSRISTDSEAPFSMEWLPALVDFKQTLVVYGYREHGADAESMDTPGESTERRPAKNLRSVFELIAICFARRNTMQPHDYSIVDISRLLCMMVHLTLERGLLEILDKIQDCILVLLRYFTPEEWPVQCPGLAHTISMFTDKAHNGVHVLNVISGLGNRAVDLQRHLALLQLTQLSRRRNPLANSRDVSSLFANAQLKGKFVDFKRFYYQVVIADTFMWCNEEFASDRIARYGWFKFLGSCSVIFIGDERPFATKLRNLASFLVTRYSESELEGLDREGSPERFDEED